jgi:hypothetical protein
VASNSLPKLFSNVPKLQGKSNWVQWKKRITLALHKTRSAKFIEKETLIPESEPDKSAWHDTDGEVAACILDTTTDHIATSCMGFITDSNRTRRSANLWAELT